MFAPGSGPDDVSCGGLGSELPPDADRSDRAAHTMTVLSESGDPGAGHVEAENHAGRRPGTIADLCRRRPARRTSRVYCRFSGDDSAIDQRRLPG